MEKPEDVCECAPGMWWPGCPVCEPPGNLRQKEGWFKKDGKWVKPAKPKPKGGG